MTSILSEGATDFVAMILNSDISAHQRASQLCALDLDVVLAAKSLSEHAKVVLGRLGAGYMTLGESLPILLPFVLEAPS